MAVDLGSAGMPQRRRMDAAVDRRIEVLVDAGGDERRTLDVAQDADVAAPFCLLVEVWRRRNSQQRKRGYRAPPYQR